MIYKSFTIKNFKGVDSVNIDLENNRIITLVGLNESGKTSVMKGMELFYKMVRGNEPTDEELKEFRQKGTAFTGNIIISATLHFEDDDKKKIQKYWSEELNKRSKLEIGDDFTYTYTFKYDKHNYQDTDRTVNLKVKTKTSSKRLYDTDNPGWIKIVTYIREEVVPEILYYDDFILQIPTQISFKVTPSEESGEEPQEMDEWMLAINDILKSVDERFDFQDDVVNIWESDEDAAVQRIAKMESVIDTKVTERWSELFGDNRVNFKEIKLDKKFSDGELTVSFKVKTKTNKVFNVNERSKGFMWFFSFLLFTEFRKKRTRNILFLLDEPASNLHSTAQAHILNALQELSEDALVVYSTHSHHLINPKWLSGAYICINENQSQEVMEGGLDLEEGASISAVSYYSYVGEGLGSDKVSYFQPILDSLDYQPSVVEPVPDIVILEGKNDWYTFKYFFEQVLKKKQINLYPGAGRDKLYEIIRLYLAWGKNFIVLLDGDDPGEESRNQYKKEIGPAVEGRIYTLRDIFKKDFETEDLMGVMDQRAIHDEVYGKGTYDTTKTDKPDNIKYNLNYALNQLQLEKKVLKVNDTTKKNFKNVYDYLKKKLKERN